MAHRLVSQSQHVVGPACQTQHLLPWLCRATLQMALAAPVGSLIAQHAWSLGVAPSAWLITREAGWSPCLAALQGHTDAVTSVAVTPDGATLVSGSGDGTVRWEGWLRPCAGGDVKGHEVSWSVSGLWDSTSRWRTMVYKVRAVAAQVQVTASLVTAFWY